MSSPASCPRCRHPHASLPEHGSIACPRCGWSAPTEVFRDWRGHRRRQWVAIFRRCIWIIPLSWASLMLASFVFSVAWPYSGLDLHNKADARPWADWVMGLGLLVFLLPLLLYPLWFLRVAWQDQRHWHAHRGRAHRLCRSIGFGMAHALIAGFYLILATLLVLILNRAMFAKYL